MTKKYFDLKINFVYVLNLVQIKNVMLIYQLLMYGCRCTLIQKKNKKRITIKMTSDNLITYC